MANARSVLHPYTHSQHYVTVNKVHKSVIVFQSSPTLCVCECLRFSFLHCSHFLFSCFCCCCFAFICPFLRSSTVLAFVQWFIANWSIEETEWEMEDEWERKRDVVVTYQYIEHQHILSNGNARAEKYNLMRWEWYGWTWIGQCCRAHCRRSLCVCHNLIE